jgi:hypothetical protein
VSTQALKEWTAAVHAMLDGRQTVLLRKGGIHEKRFDLASSEFVFFPTVAHGHSERVRPEHRDLLRLSAADSTEDDVLISAGAKVVAAIEVNDPAGLEAVAAHHIWTAASVRADRLDFRPKHRLTVLVISARPLTNPVRLPRTPAYAGCTSWVQLSLTPTWGAPVHGDDTLRAIAEDIRRSVG